MAIKQGTALAHRLSVLWSKAIFDSCYSPTQKPLPWPNQTLANLPHSPLSHYTAPAQPTRKYLPLPLWWNPAHASRLLSCSLCEAFPDQPSLQDLSCPSTPNAFNVHTLAGLQAYMVSFHFLVHLNYLDARTVLSDLHVVSTVFRLAHTVLKITFRILCMLSKDSSLKPYHSPNRCSLGTSHLRTQSAHMHLAFYRQT